MKYTLGCIDNPGWQLWLSIDETKVRILQAARSFECESWHLFFSTIVFANKSGKHFRNETVLNIWVFYYSVYIKFQFVEGCGGAVLGSLGLWEGWQSTWRWLEWHLLVCAYRKGSFFWVCLTFRRCTIHKGLFRGLTCCLADTCKPNNEKLIWKYAKAFTEHQQRGALDPQWVVSLLYPLSLLCNSFFLDSISDGVETTCILSCLIALCLPTGKMLLL